jgi:fructoselysine 6-phosphate deglycase
MLDQQVEVVLEKLGQRTFQRVFFVACGGSLAVLYPAKYVLDRESATLSSEMYSSNEFIHRNPKSLGKDSLVVLCSLSGTTPETAQAAVHAREAGATTVAFTEDLSSPLGTQAEFPIQFKWGAENDPFTSNYSLLYQLIFGLLNQRGEYGKLDEVVAGLQNLQLLFDRAKEQYHQNAADFAAEYKDDKVIYTMASGINYGIAYSFTTCILMEMQWIHSHVIHAGEYFHGPFEILDKDVPMIILLSLDETRALDERALSFSQRYGKRLIVLDAQDLNLDGVPSAVKGVIAPIVLNFILRRYAEELATARNHPLSQRRYMWKVEY